VRRENDRRVRIPDRGVEARHPGVAAGAGPAAKVHALAIAAPFLPQSLPVAGAAVVEAGNGQHNRLARVTRKTESLHRVILILVRAFNVILFIR